MNNVQFLLLVYVTMKNELDSSLRQCYSTSIKGRFDRRLTGRHAMNRILPGRLHRDDDL